MFELLAAINYIALVKREASCRRNNSDKPLLIIIQTKLYISGSRNIWQNDKKCSKFDVNLLYAPITGECLFSNPEFTTKMNFDENRRLNMIDDEISSDESIISILGDSFTMGWGVNDHETYSSILERKTSRKVYNQGV